MKQIKLTVIEVVTTTHIVQVSDDHKLLSRDDLDDLDEYAQQIGEQDSEPVETIDAQIQEITNAEWYVSN
jgi:hypothetical protein